MAEVSEIEAGGEIRTIKDPTARKSLVYSTGETNTGKRWTNNKPIYRRVFVNNSYSLREGVWNNISSIFSNYSSAEIDEVINANLYFVSNALNEQCVVKTIVAKNAVFVSSAISPKTNSKVQLVIEYTKTID